MSMDRDGEGQGDGDGDGGRDEGTWLDRTDGTSGRGDDPETAEGELVS